MPTIDNQFQVCSFLHNCLQAIIIALLWDMDCLKYTFWFFARESVLRYQIFLAFLGAGLMVYEHSAITSNGYVTFGFNEDNFRIWSDSSVKGSKCVLNGIK